MHSLSLILRKLVWLIGIVIVSLIALQLILSWIARQSNTSDFSAPEVTLPPFPIGVNPVTQTINEVPGLDLYRNQFVQSNHTPNRRNHTFASLVQSQLELFTWYQQLATPSRRVLVIRSGERHEQIADNFRQLLGWDAEETARFIAEVQAYTPTLNEGVFFPGRYYFDIPTTPEVAAFAINQRFLSEVLVRYTPELEAQLPLAEALTIASLIEREAYDFNDMRIISGVIWNRLFIDMPLQLDATLQYVRGVPGNNRAWWPIPRPADKFLVSPYNTYENKGLPPGPIANPSIDALIAALNPRSTECLFYFHTDDGTFYCTKTYEEHVSLLQEKF